MILTTYSNSETEKQAICRDLIKNHNSVVSIQVLQELCNVANKKFKLPFEQAALLVKECSTNNVVHANFESTLIMACQIAAKYRYAFYDCLIIAAALESNCSILFSEDLQDGQVIEQTLVIKNPFSTR